MAIEHNEGRARPRLPRSSDLPAVADRGAPRPVTGAATDPRTGRDASGRFAPGNRVGELTGGWQSAVRELLGNVEHADADVRRVAAHAWKIFRGVLADLPATGPVVESLAAEHARQTALAAFYAGKAAEAGLTTDAGLGLAERASKAGQRAERVAVTMTDLALRAARKEPPPIDMDALARRAEERANEARAASRGQRIRTTAIEPAPAPTGGTP